MSVNFILTLSLLQSTGLTANKLVLALFALELGASPLVVGILIALFSLAAATLAVTVGRLADRFGPRWLMVAGSTGSILGMLLPYSLPSLITVLIAGALGGLSLACYNVTLQNLTGLISTPENRARSFSNYSLTGSAGNLLGPLLGGFSIEHFGHMQSCVLLASLACVPLLLLASRWKAMGTRPAPAGVRAAAHAEGGTLALFRNAGIRKTIINASFLSSGLNLFQAYMPVYLHSTGLAPSVIGVVVAMNATAAVVIRVLLPRAIAWLKVDGVMALSFCSGALALALIPMFQHPVVLGMLAFVFGMGMGAGQPIVTMLIFQYSPPGRSGEAIGLKITTNHITSMVSPVAFGAIATAFGLAPMFWVNALMMTAGIYVSRLNSKNRGRHEEEIDIKR